MSLLLASVARDLHFGKEGSRVKVISESLFSEQYLDHLFCFQLFLSPLCPTDIAAVGEDGKAEEGSWFEKGCEQKKKNYQDFHSFISAELARPTNCGGSNEESARI